MTSSSEIILIRADGALILQHRDNKPTIVNPDAITSFGGTAEGDETPIQAAVREINEETSLGLTANQLTFWRKYHKTKAVHGLELDVYYFLAHNISDANLEIYEGQGYVILTGLHEAANFKFSTLFREVLADYYQEFGAPTKH